MKRIIAFIIMILTIPFAFLVGCDKKAENSEDKNAVILASEEKTSIDFDDDNYITWYGRVEHLSKNEVSFNYCATGFEVKFRGTELAITLGTTGFIDADHRIYVSIMVDGETYNPINKYGLEVDNKVIIVKAEQGEHSVRLLKNVETRENIPCSLKALATDGAFLKVNARSERFIEIYGDSITCGYGNIDNKFNGSDKKFGGYSTVTEDTLQAYGYLTAIKLGAECSIMSASGHAILKSAFSDPSLPKDPITIPDMLTRTSYYNATPYVNPRNPQAVVLNCGTNDTTYINNGSSAAEIAQRETNYVNAYIDFISAIRARYPGVKIFICCGMLTAESVMKPALDRVIAGAGGNDITYVSLHNMWYTYDGVYGDIGGDGHPGAKCHADAAEVLSSTIKSVMGW